MGVREEGGTGKDRVPVVLLDAYKEGTGVGSRRAIKHRNLKGATVRRAWPTAGTTYSKIGTQTDGSLEHV